MLDSMAGNLPRGVLQRKIAQRRAAAGGAKDAPPLPAPASGGGTALPDAVRGRMERSFGADFSDVRVHQDDKAGAIGAEAYTRGTDLHFAPGTYDPGSEQGQQLIGHELAHVQQQRAGRVAGVQGKNAEINSDAGLESEADVAADAAMRGEPATLGGGNGKLQSSAIQGYFKVKNQDFGTKGVVSQGAQFSGQDEDQDQNSPTFGSFLQQDGKTRTSDKQGADLRVANSGELAMENTDLLTRQAKVFFATGSKIGESNRELRALGSRFQLLPTGQKLTVPDRAGTTTNELSQVTIENVLKPKDSTIRSGINTSVSEHCNAMSAEVTGAEREDNQSLNQGSLTQAPKGSVYKYVDTEIAAFVAEYIANGGDVARAAEVSDLKMPIPDKVTREKVLDGVAKRYGKTLHDAKTDPDLRARLETLEQQLGINSFASPDIGETYVTASVGISEQRDGGGQGVKSVRDYQKNPNQPQVHEGGGQDYVDKPWGYHWGAVVAKSGEDRITLENYARNDEDQVAKRNNVNPDEESRFYFQMYGAANERDGEGQEEDQSWHGVWKKLGFANPVTMAMHNGSRGKFEATVADRNARVYFTDITAIQDQHAVVGQATTAKLEADALLQALAVALAHHDRPTSRAEQKVRQRRLKAWRLAVRAARGRHEENAPLIAHVLEELRTAEKAQRKITKPKKEKKSKKKEREETQDTDDTTEGGEGQEDDGDPKVARLFLLIDVESKSFGPKQIVNGDVGHTWISIQHKKPDELDDDVDFGLGTSGAQHRQHLKDGTNRYADPMGFYPHKWEDENGERQGGYSANPFHSYVEGELKHPDRGHEQQEKATQVWDITQDELERVLVYAESKRGAQYSLYYFNCTTFAKEAVQAAGKSPPKMGTKGVLYPNAAYQGIKKQNKKGRGETYLTGLEKKTGGGGGKNTE